MTSTTSKPRPANEPWRQPITLATARAYVREAEALFAELERRSPDVRVARAKEAA